MKEEDILNELRRLQTNPPRSRILFALKVATIARIYKDSNKRPTNPPPQEIKRLYTNSAQKARENASYFSGYLNIPFELPDS